MKTHSSTIQQGFKSIEEIGREVEAEMQMGGLSDGIYMDFAKEVAIRHRKGYLLSLAKERIERLRGEMLPTKDKGYDGGNLDSACDHYHRAFDSWAEVIRFEDGYNAAKSEEIAKEEEIIKELNKIK